MRRTTYLVLVTGTLVALARCSDGIGLRPPENSVEVIVSGLVRAPAGAPGRGAPAAASALGTSLVYVSLSPGAVPAGVQATIANEATGQSVATALVNGGFDPVPLAASIGDTLAIDITSAVSAVLAHVRLAVSPVRPLKVVRTSPPSGGHDVPLNATIVVVFSEPIDAATLTSGAVQLLRDTTPVPGTVQFADSTHLKVAFQPAALLAAQTSYRLVVTQTARGVNGVALDSSVAVSFTTGTATSVPFSLSPTSVVFANQTIGTTSAPETVTLTNPGTASEPVSIVMNGYGWTDFLPRSDCPAELTGGASCTISITFTPGAAGSRTGILVIDGDLPQEHLVNVDGTATSGLSMAVVPDTSGKVGRFVYVANSLSDNISMYAINRATGVLTPLVPPTIGAGTQPVSLAVEPSGKFAYVANVGSNNVSMFTIDATTGALTAIGSPFPAGSSPVSVAVAPDASGRVGNFVYVANGSGGVSTYAIDTTTGALTPIASPVTAYRPVSVAVDASGKFAYVAVPSCSDGTNSYLNTCVLTYTIDASTGALTRQGPVVTGASGPSSMAIDPSGRFLALTNEDWSVWMFAINAATGALTVTGGTSTDPSPTAVAIDPSDRYAYETTAGPGSATTAGPGSPACSNIRGCSGVLMFGINSNGVLTFKGTIAAGSYPASIAIDPSGKFVYVANFGSLSISTYSIGIDGTLTLIGTIGT